jgi:4-hydroxyphenylacetate 3-monooxygenase
LYRHDQATRRNGTMDEMTALVDRCTAEYDETGWRGDTCLNPAD